MAPYILFLAEKRKQARADGNEALATTQKFMGNALGGKFIENPRGRKKVRVIQNAIEYLRAVADVSYIGHTELTDKVSFAEFHPTGTLTLDKLVSVGQSMLDHAKTHMYRTFYRFHDKCGEDYTPLF